MASSLNDFLNIPSQRHGLTPIEQAQRYVAKCDAAISGAAGHTKAFGVICTVVNGFDLSEGDALHALRDWNSRCQPPWKEHELLHKIREAPKSKLGMPRGHKLSNRSNGRSHRMTESPAASPAVKPVKYQLKEDDLPEPIPDGCRELIRALFKEGEGIRIAPAKIDDEDSKEVPNGGGTCLTREAWLKKLERHDGNPNGIFSSSDRTGIYIGINPYKPACTKDADVIDFRHALIEFDEKLSPEEQFNLYQQMQLPCAAIIFSGGKSVHAWVKIDARDRTEYDERVRILYAHFEAAGYDKLDVKNKNPGRLSRLPNCIRFDRRQEVLALNTGKASFSEWLSEVQGDDLGERDDVDDLDAVDMEDMSDVLLGDDWINKGGSLLMSGPSGVGKSSLVIQMAVYWACGLVFMGIKPTRPLKTVIIGAENDRRDNKRILFGILDRMEIDKGFTPDKWASVKANVIFRYNYTASSERFVAVGARIAEKEKPDLMALDPAAAFVGDDISKQTVIASFFRNGLHPIAKARGFAWIVINHFTKPPGDSKARAGWTSSDHQYRGAGSYDLTGWARAGMVLSEVGSVFQLRFAKRGKQAGATHPNGEPTLVAWLQHAQQGVFWEQVGEPQQSEDGKPAKASKGIAELLSFVPVGESILKADLIADARAAGFTARGAADTLNRALHKGRNGEPPALTIEKVKRPGTNPAQMVSRTPVNNSVNK